MTANRTSGITRARRALGSLALIGALSGCAAVADSPTVLQKGEFAPGQYLATLVVVEDGCWPHGTACAVQGLDRGLMVLPADPFTPPEVYERMARELCHAVAGVRGVADGARLCAAQARDSRVSLR